MYDWKCVQHLTSTQPPSLTHELQTGIVNLSISFKLVLSTFLSFSLFLQWFVTIMPIYAKMRSIEVTCRDTWIQLVKVIKKELDMGIFEEWRSIQRMITFQDSFLQHARSSSFSFSSKRIMSYWVVCEPGTRLHSRKGQISQIMLPTTCIISLTDGSTTKERSTVVLQCT